MHSGFDPTHLEDVSTNSHGVAWTVQYLSKSILKVIILHPYVQLLGTSGNNAWDVLRRCVRFLPGFKCSGMGGRYDVYAHFAGFLHILYTYSTSSFSYSCIPQYRDFSMFQGI